MPNSGSHSTDKVPHRRSSIRKHVLRHVRVYHPSSPSNPKRECIQGCPQGLRACIAQVCGMTGIVVLAA